MDTRAVNRTHTVALAIKLDKGFLYLRRDQQSPIEGGKLAMLSGNIKRGETPLQAALRTGDDTGLHLWPHQLDLRVEFESAQRKTDGSGELPINVHLYFVNRNHNGISEVRLTNNEYTEKRLIRMSELDWLWLHDSMQNSHRNQPLPKPSPLEEFTQTDAHVIREYAVFLRSAIFEAAQNRITEPHENFGSIKSSTELAIA